MNSSYDKHVALTRGGMLIFFFRLGCRPLGDAAGESNMFLRVDD